MSAWISSSLPRSIPPISAPSRSKGRADSVEDRSRRSERESPSHREGREHPEALALAWEQHRARLHRIVQVRMDVRLQGKVDPDDVLQEAFLDALTRFSEYLKTEKVDLFLWLRSIVC